MEVLGVVLLDILEDQILDLLPSEVAFFQREVELPRAHGLIVWVVQPTEVRVLQSLLHTDPLVWVELQHPVDQVEGQRVSVRKVLPQNNALARRHGLQVPLGLLAVNEG